MRPSGVGDAIGDVEIQEIWTRKMITKNHEATYLRCSQQMTWGQDAYLYIRDAEHGNHIEATFCQ